MEVDEEDAAAALHHPPRGHGRVDATGEERRHRARRPHREPTGAGRRVDVHERLGGQHLDVNLELGAVQVHARGGPLEHERAERAVELHRRHRIRLEGAPGADPERGEGAPLDEPADHGLHRVERGRNAVRERGARHAADAERPLAHALGRRVGVEVEENATRELAEAHGGEVRGGSGEVPGEVPEEERAVAALQPDLVVVHDHRGTQPGHCHEVREAGFIRGWPEPGALQEPAPVPTPRAC